MGIWAPSRPEGIPPIGAVLRNRSSSLARVGATLLALAAFSTPSFAGSVSPFDGVWTGAIDNSIRVEVRIVDDKAVAYSVKNTPIDIKFSRESGDAIVFGDPDNYVFKLQRSGAAILNGLLSWIFLLFAESFF